MKSHDWHRDMSVRQSEIVKVFERKGWVITGENEKHEILMDNRDDKESKIKRRARISRTPY